MRVRIRDIRFGVSDCPTRLPFRFGINTMTWAPTLTARVELDTDAGSAVGYAADLLVPKWFEKDPQKSIEDDVRGLMASAVAAAEVAQDVGQGEASGDHAETVFDLWWRTYQARVHDQPADASDRLLRGFGVALVERAVLDATCRAAGATFFEALKTDLFGVRPRVLYPELEGWSLADSLPPTPLSRVALRHTVGLVDALRTSDIPEGSRVGDGLPEALEEDIAAFGLDWFKLKLCGDGAVDLPRCLAFAEVLAESSGDDRRITVDGNEQFESLGSLSAFLEQLGRDPRGADLLERLTCIEQPLARAKSLEAGLEPGLAALSRFAPVILDEADHGVEALPRALDLGYGGISVKNCKGVLRALVGRGLCERRGAIQSAEDLTNLGVLALQQDLCTVAALGLPHVERNGHHYFPGLDHLPGPEALSAAMTHPTLWSRTKERTTLRIVDGSLDLTSLQTVGYGYASEIDWDARTPLEDWTFRPPSTRP